MNTFDRYLVANIAGGLLIAAAVLLPLFGFLDLLEELEDVGEGYYTTRDAFEYVLLMQPRRLIQLMPFIALLGTVIALGRLAVANELTAIRATGTSALAISGSALKVATLLLMLLAVLEQFVAPTLQQQGLALRSEALAQTTELGKDLGIWTRDAGEILRIGDASQSRNPRDIEIFQLDETGFMAGHLSAERAEIENDGSWTLRNVLQRRLADGRLQASRVESLSWMPFLSPRQISTLSRPPDSLAPVELYEYVRYLRATGQREDSYALALWRKLGSGIMLVAMLLLSIPFALGSVRGGLGQRLVIAAVVGIAAYLLDQIVSNAGLLLSLSPPVIALVPGLIMLFAAVWVLHRCR